MSVLKVKDNGEWKAIPSIKGETGDAAGFGTATASVDTGTGTPSCVVTLTGEDTAKNFDFAFHNLMYDDSDLQSDFADLSDDFDVLQGQFDTAVAALTVDSEVADIRVGDDGVTYASAGAAVRGQFHDVKSDIGDFETYINPYYKAIKEYDSDYFFTNGRFSVTGGTATIDNYAPLTVTNTSSGTVRSGAIAIDTSQTNICIDLVETSRKSMAGTMAFFTANSGYISQTDFTVSSGKAFKSIAIPSTAAKVFLFLNFYETTTYTFESINVYYGAQQINEKTFADVLKSNVGLLGLKWSAVGDSLTDKATLGSGANNYTNYASDALGLNLVNLGVAGTGYMNANGISKAFWQRYSDIPADTDVLTVFGSLNDLDLAYNNVGGLKDNNTTTLYGCMNTFLAGVYSRNVGMRVGMILPTPWQWMNRRYPNETTTLKTEQYINALIEFAKFNSIPILNLFDESGMHPWDESFRTTYYKNSDGTHPNSLGHYRFIYPKVKAFIEQLVAK